MRVACVKESPKRQRVKENPIKLDYFGTFLGIIFLNLFLVIYQVRV